MGKDVVRKNNSVFKDKPKPDVREKVMEHGFSFLFDDIQLIIKKKL